MAAPTSYLSLTLTVFVTLFLSEIPASGQGFAFNPRVEVQQETRIDWISAVSGRSIADPPKELLKGYRSDLQNYVLYGPTNVANGRGYPLILCISYRSTSFGWDYCRGTCMRHGVVYAEPLRAGNRVPMAQRVRIVVDVLDDVRRRFPIDPDRTYLMGYSGGGTTAGLILRTLPEYFGGALLSSGHSPIPQVPWQAQRMKERLSLSMHAGSLEKSVALELKHVSGPLYQEVGIRSHYYIHEGMWHAMVSPATVEQVYQWLEAGLSQRRAMANLFPTTRITGNPTRQQWAAAMLDEAKKRLENPNQIVAGLEQLNTIANRWPDLDEGKQAKGIFDDYQSREPRPWVAEAKKARLRLTQRLAEQYESLATGNIGSSKVRRSTFARGALMNWKIIIKESDDG